MQAGAKNVLMIGCGGGTLATMLSRCGVNVTLVDVNKISFDIARGYFNLPESVDCYVADGIAWLRKDRRRFDAIVLDAFGAGGMPEAFTTPAFFRLVAARLKRGGLFLMNVIVEDDDDPLPDDLVRRMHKVWRGVRLLDTDGWIDRNAVIAAGAVANLRKPKVLMPPQPGGAKLARELDILDWRRIR
jgi:spermidine synthase